MKTKSLTQRLLAMLMAVMMVFSAVPAALLLSADAATSTSASASAKKLSKAKVTVTTPVKYTGKAKKPTVKVTYGKKTLKEGKHYTVKYYNNKEVGYAKVKVSAIKKSGYTGSKTAKFRIQPAKVGGLKVTKTENGVNPLCFGQTALLGCDARTQFEPWRTLNDPSGNIYYVFRQIFCITNVC